MTSEPRAFLAIDLGAATVSVALVGKLGVRWRLLGSIALPAGDRPETAIAILLERLAARAIPELAERLGLTGVAGRRPGPRSRSAPTPPRTLGRRRRLGAGARRRSWRPRRASGWRIGRRRAPRRPTRSRCRALLLDPGVDAILVGAGDPPGADERGASTTWPPSSAAAATRRPDRRVVLAGGDGRPAGARSGTRRPDGGRDRPRRRPPGREPAGEPLAALLLELARPADDARRAPRDGRAPRSPTSLDRRVELIEIGLDGGLRAIGRPGVGDRGGPAAARRRRRPPALAPAEPDDATVDARARRGPRSRSTGTGCATGCASCGSRPWADATGDGARPAAGGRPRRARAPGRDDDRRRSDPPPDLVVASGGVVVVAARRRSSRWPSPTSSGAPARRQLAFDHARLLGPIGSDPRRDGAAGPPRRPRSTTCSSRSARLVMPSGLRRGRPAGRLIVHDGDRHDVTELAPGGPELASTWPPGDRRRRRAPIPRHGPAGRPRPACSRSTSPAASAGLLVDLRDVPLRLPDRADGRRELLAGLAGGRSGRR